jgi:ketosteroid isomerase-like protein
MKLLFTLLSLSILLSLSAQSKDEQAIRNILSYQVSEWNKGDIEGYMKGYWENDSLLFVGKSGPKYGYFNTLQSYKKNYPGPTAMGKLSFEILKVQQLAADCYFVLGKWMLQRSMGDISGHYTLIFRKIHNQWVIISDHSS